MAKLILSMDGLVLKEVELTKERTTVGRRPHNDIVIDNLAVSGEHAVLITILNDSFVEDLGSTNGTTVNGQPIKKHFLQNNDTVELGKYKLKFVAEAKPGSDYQKVGVRGEDATRSLVASRNLTSTSLNPTVPGGATTGIANATTDPRASMASRSHPEYGGATASSMPMPGTSTAPSAPRAGGAAATATIQILNGPNAGKELALSKALTTLGRPGVQVAVITRRPQGYFITHVEGSSFPVVNGKALGLDATALTNHDIIELSGTKMEFFYR